MKFSIWLLGALLFSACTSGQEPRKGDKDAEPTVVYKDASPLHDIRRVETIVKHEDGTVTARVQPVALSPAETAQLLRPSVSAPNSGGTPGKVSTASVQAVGTFVMVRDTPTRIEEIEKLLVAFDPVPQPIEVEIKLVWGRRGEPNKDEAARLRSRILVFHTSTGEEFRSAGTEERSFVLSHVEQPGGNIITKGSRRVGITVQGRARPAASGFTLQLKIEIIEPFGENTFASEQVDLAATVEGGDSTCIHRATQNKGADSKPDLELIVFASAKRR